MIVLASQSPRRSELLTKAGIPFRVRVSPVEEVPRPGEQSVAYAMRLARSKAEAVPLHPDEIALGADTVVVVDHQILEKPANDADAVRMLRLLSGREHEVVTGVCVRSPRETACEHEITAVRFSKLSESEIERYVASGECHGKAGAYAIQGLASKFVERVEGCYFNIVGLPVSRVYRMLKRAGAIQ